MIALTTAERRLLELNSERKKYGKLLVDELEGLVGLAYAHGWRSTRYEQGVEARNRIAKLEAEISSMGIEIES
jgi:hypothetical protein